MIGKIIILDSTPVSLITNPKAESSPKECQKWFKTLLDRDYNVILPEIVDYEVRRELLRANKKSGLQKLDQLKAEIIYLSITTEVMLQQIAIKRVYVQNAKTLSRLDLVTKPCGGFDRKLL